MKIKYRVLIQWSNEGNCFLVSLPNFPDPQEWVTYGVTHQEVLEQGLVGVMEDLIEIYKEQGKPIPEPQIVKTIVAC